MLSHDKSPPLRNLTVLPLLLSPDRDDELLRLTEGRVPTFSHDLVPDYLRTKPEPDVERQMIQMEHKAANLAYESAQVCQHMQDNKDGIEPHRFGKFYM
jgi:mediator of RNA polymerase II transcription subunit 8